MAGRLLDGAGRPAPREGGFRPDQRSVPCRSPRLEGPGRQEEVVLVLPVVHARTRAVYFSEASSFYGPPTSAQAFVRKEIR